MEFNGTAGYGTVRPVVWGAGGGNPASHPISKTAAASNGGYKRRKTTMNTEYTRRVPARFAPETRFDLAPPAAIPNRAALDAELEQLKSRLIKEHLLEKGNVVLAPAFRRAANEAAALAWLTPYPLLLLPTLLSEKVEAVQRYGARQAEIRRRSRVAAEAA